MITIAAATAITTTPRTIPTSTLCQTPWSANATSEIPGRRSLRTPPCALVRMRTLSPGMPFLASGRSELRFAMPASLRSGSAPSAGSGPPSVVASASSPPSGSMPSSVAGSRRAGRPAETSLPSSGSSSSISRGASIRRARPGPRPRPPSRPTPPSRGPPPRRGRPAALLARFRRVLVAGSHRSPPSRAVAVITLATGAYVSTVPTPRDRRPLASRRQACRRRDPGRDSRLRSARSGGPDADRRPDQHRGLGHRRLRRGRAGRGGGGIIAGKHRG